MADKRLNMASQLAQFTLNFKASYSDDPCANVVYVRKETSTADVITSGTWGDTTAEEQAGNLRDAWYAHMAAVQSQYIALESIAWVWNDRSTTPHTLHEGVVTADLPINGTITGEPLPLGISKALRLQTGLGGRSNHGRIFLAGLALSQINSSAPDHLTSAAYTAMTAAGAAFLSGFNNNDIVLGGGQKYSLVVASFIHAGAVRPESVDNYVTAINLSNDTVDYQRRRAG